MNRRSFISLAATIGLTAGITLGACGDDSDSDASESTAGAAGVTVEGAWARTSPMMAEAGAAYFTITSSDDDALVAVSADPSVAGTVEMHETRMVETTGMSETTMGGSTDTMTPAMEMVPIDRIELPAGESVALEPGGLHLMLLDLSKPLEFDQTFTLTLTFENAPEQQVQVTVRDEAP